MKKLFLSLLASAVSLLSAPPVLAQSLPSDIIRIEVLDGGAKSDGAHVAGLKLTLAQGWKTYWRAPGDAGIPPTFHWKGSRNLDRVQISWPTPDVFHQNGLRSIGYENQVVLPVTIFPKRAGQTVRLRGKVDLGVCKDVCVPATIAFDQRLDPDAKRHGAIAAAMADRPYSAREAGVSHVSCQLDPISDGLRLTARITMPSAGGTEVTVIESGSPYLWASEAQSKRSGKVLTTSADLVQLEQTPAALDRSQLRITVLGRNRAVDIRGCSGG